MKAVNATVTSIRKPMIEDFMFPVLPLTIQREIVRILDNFTELTARKKQYKYYLDQLIEHSDNDDVKWLPLGESSFPPGKGILRL